MVVAPRDPDRGEQAEELDPRTAEGARTVNRTVAQGVTVVAKHHAGSAPRLADRAGLRYHNLSYCRNVLAQQTFRIAG